MSTSLVIFWKFTVFWHRFHLILAKQNLISSMRNIVYKLSWNQKNLKLEWRSAFSQRMRWGEEFSTHQPKICSSIPYLKNPTHQKSIPPTLNNSFQVITSHKICLFKVPEVYLEPIWKFIENFSFCPLNCRKSSNVQVWLGQQYLHLWRWQ